MERRKERSQKRLRQKRRAVFKRLALKGKKKGKKGKKKARSGRK